MADLIKIKVTRPFQIAGKIVKKDKIVEVSKAFAHELIHNQKAVAAEALKPEVIKSVGGEKK